MEGYSKGILVKTSAFDSPQVVSGIWCTGIRKGRSLIHAGNHMEMRPDDLVQPAMLSAEKVRIEKVPLTSGRKRNLDLFRVPRGLKIGSKL